MEPSKISYWDVLGNSRIKTGDFSEQEGFEWI